MKKLITFDHWEEDEDAPFLSGASDKRLLVNSATQQAGIFKFPKQHANETYTREHFSESIASELAELLSIPVAKVDLGVYNGRVGSMSYMMVDSNKEDLQHGLDYIANKYPLYNQNKFKDPITNELYSVQMIQKCIDGLGIQQDFMKIIIFDALIGNSDRHHSNWGVIKNKFTNEIRMAPLYDNGSSLACYVLKEDIENYFKDDLRFNALIFSKSKSRIGWDNVPKPRHFELLKQIKEVFYHDTIKMIENINSSLSDEIIDDLLHKYNELMEKEEINLISRFLKVRRETILKIYGLIM